MQLPTWCAVGCKGHLTLDDGNHCRDAVAIDIELRSHGHDIRGACDHAKASVGSCRLERMLPAVDLDEPLRGTISEQ